jgi:PKD repeat protein
MNAPTLRQVTRGAAVLVLLAGTGCTVKKQEAPPLAGPSEYGTSITVAVSPDLLVQNGYDSSRVTVTALDERGQPKSSVNLRADIRVDGIVTDYGTLSQRSLSTGSDGRATFVYTAPAAPAVSSDNGTVVQIVVTPIGTDSANQESRLASIRLVPPGVIVPPAGLVAAFSIAPEKPKDGQFVLFDANASQAGQGNMIASYSWDFGDGSHGSGVTASHAYSTQGVYVVRLTITDTAGRSAQKAASLEVQQGDAPVAVISFSPGDPLVNQPINFNAALSIPVAGRQIVSYSWAFGDGTFASGPIASHSYGLPRTYEVLLTLTDDAGKQSTAKANVSVKVPTPVR